MELKKILETIYPGTIISETGNQVEECVRAGYLLAELIDNIIITLGKRGVVVVRRGTESDPFFNPGTQAPISHRLYQPQLINSNEIVNVSGAGDCFASGFISAMLKGKPEKDCIESGFKCSAASLKCLDTVPPKF